MFAKNSFEVEQILKENRALKERIAILEPRPDFNPGQSLESLGL